MRVYIIDFWHIFIIKALGRIMKPTKKEDNEEFLGRMEHAAMMIHIGTFASIAVSVFVFSNHVYDIPFTRQIPTVLIVSCYVWLVFRHQKNEKWILIEKSIDEKYSKRKRDIIFSLLFIGFFFAYSITLMGLFICS